MNIEEIEKRLKAGANGEWVLDGYEEEAYFRCEGIPGFVWCDDEFAMTQETATFLQHAPTDIRYLLDQVERFQGLLYAATHDMQVYEDQCYFPLGDEGTLTVSIDPELAEWLRERAAANDALLAYRRSADIVQEGETVADAVQRVRALKGKTDGSA